MYPFNYVKSLFTTLLYVKYIFIFRDKRLKRDKRLRDKQLKSKDQALKLKG